MILKYGRVGRSAHEENYSHTPYISKKSKALASAAQKGTAVSECLSQTVIFGQQRKSLQGRGKPLNHIGTLNFYER